MPGRWGECLTLNIVMYLHAHAQEKTLHLPRSSTAALHHAKFVPPLHCPSAGQHRAVLSMLSHICDTFLLPEGDGRAKLGHSIPRARRWDFALTKGCLPRGQTLVESRWLMLFQLHSKISLLENCWFSMLNSYKSHLLRRTTVRQRTAVAFLSPRTK